MSFADIAVSNRNIKNSFLETISKHVDWVKIEEIILKNYNKGKRADGRHAYSGLVLFKMCLLQEWYGVSAKKLEIMVNDSVSMSHFLEQSLDEKIPSAHTFLSFKYEMIRKDVFLQLTDSIKDNLEKKSIKIKKGSFKTPVLVKKKS